MPGRRAYFDTSVLVKRYVVEPGSGRARRLISGRTVVSSAVAPVELTSAVCRRRAARELTQEQVDAILAHLQHERRRWDLVSVSHSVTERAQQVIRRSGMRTLDALHLASALVFVSTSGLALPFVTADAGQAHAAEQLGLDVIEVG